ncbi:MAG: GNAT family N-acetyltransferase [Gaiellales bacterium]
MTVVELRDREAIAAFCRRRPGAHAYALGDLDDFFWPHTRWWAWKPGNEIEQLVLLYTEPDPPVILAIAEEPTSSMESLLRELNPELPRDLYAHVTPDCLPALAGDREVVDGGWLHHKLSVDTNDLPEPTTAEKSADLRLLGPDALDEVEAFYRHAYPGTWFVPRMLETRRYLGLMLGGELASIAGVHVYSPTWNAAALGNVATLPAHRGRGVGKTVCLALCRILAADGIRTISLNVKADNAPALAVYRALGFGTAVDYVEALMR